MSRSIAVIALALLSLACSNAIPAETPSEAPSRRPDLTSNCQIESGKEFLFGGGSNGNYTIDARNGGTVTLEIAAESPDGKRTPIATLAPGQRALHTFADGQTAIVRNTSDSIQALAILRVWGETRVGMRYRDAGEGK
jgi:hypothetical protein